MSPITSPVSLSRMDQPHLIGNFASPAPLDKKALGPPSQIAYYSCFPGSTDEYEYQSRSALKFYSPPAAPFSFTKAPDMVAWSKQCNYLDSLPWSELEPIIASCQRAGRTADLREADIITRRGALVKYVYSLASLTSSLHRSSLAVGKEEEYNVSFVDGKLHIFLKSFVFRTEIGHRFVPSSCVPVLLFLTHP